MDSTTIIVQTISNIAVIIGLPLALIQYYRTTQKEIKDREYGTYNALDEKYIEFQKLCLLHPELDVFDISDSVGLRLNDIQKKQELILFTMLFAIFERSYLLYHEQSDTIKKKQWSGWETYITEYCKRDNFLKAWEISGKTFDTDFEAYMNEKIDLQKAERLISES